MSSIREQIVVAFVAALNAPEAKPCVFSRTRVDMFAAAELPGGVVYAMQDDSDERGADVNLHKARVRVEIVVAGEAPADALIDPIYVYVVNTVMANESAVWAVPGLKQLKEIRTQFESEASYQDSTMAFVEFEAIFATMTDPTVAFN